MGIRVPKYIYSKCPHIPFFYSKRHLKSLAWFLWKSIIVLACWQRLIRFVSRHPEEEKNQYCISSLDELEICTQFEYWSASIWRVLTAHVQKNYPYALQKWIFFKKCKELSYSNLAKRKKRDQQMWLRVVTV